MDLCMDFICLFVVARYIVQVGGIPVDFGVDSWL